MKLNANFIFVFVLAIYTFFGVSLLQGALYFTNLGNEVEINLTLSSEEELQEENKVKFHYVTNHYNLEILELTKQFYKAINISSITHFAEIPTPPPEFS